MGNFSMGIKYIIAGGDSFTLGSELAADELIENYTSNIGHNEELWAEHNNIFHSMPLEELRSYRDKCKNKSWANKFANKISTPISNVAVGGSSNSEIVFHLTNEYDKQKNLVNPEDILLLVMVTSPYRLGIPDKTNIRKYLPIFPHSEIPFFPNQKIQQSNEEFYMEKYTEKDFLWNSFAHLIALKYYVESLGSKILFLDSCLWSSFGDNSFDNLLDIKYILSEYSDGKSLSGGHFLESAHEALANKLFEDININSHISCKEGVINGLQ